MKKLLFIITSLLLTASLFAEKNQQILRIATFPFIGSEITDTIEKEFLAGLFTSEFIPLGYTSISQTSDLEVTSAERDYQTAEIAKIGKEAAAEYVLIGSLFTTSDQISLTIEVIEIELSKIIASEIQHIDNMDDIHTVAEGMIERLNSEINNIVVISQKIASEKKLIQDLKNANRNKWIGKGVWIGGTVIMGASGIIMLTQFTSGVRDNVETAAILFGIGGAFTVGGIITHIVFGVRENKLQKKLESQGVSFSVIPDLTSDSLHLALKYSF